MPTVLLVDDDAAVRQFARTVLERAGFQLMCASNGLEALQLYESYAARIDLLLTDLDMPEMGGLELFKRVSSTHPSVRVLIMSGGPPASNPAFRHYPFLGKPFRPGELVDAVGIALEQSKERAL